MDRNRFVSWEIVGLFLLQLALFAVAFVKTTPEPSFVVWDVVAREAVLVNETVEFLLPTGLKTEDWWIGLLAMPVVYYGTAVVVAAVGRIAWQSGR